MVRLGLLLFFVGLVLPGLWQVTFGGLALAIFGVGWWVRDVLEEAKRQALRERIARLERENAELDGIIRADVSRGAAGRGPT